MLSELELATKVLAMIAVLSLTVSQMGLSASVMAAAQANWKSTESRVVYQSNPNIDPGDRLRYNVLPCLVRMSNGSLVALVEPGPWNATSSEPIFICSTDGGKNWSEPYSGVLPEGVGKIHTLGARRDGRLMATVWKGSSNLLSPTLKKWSRKGDSALKLPDGRKCEAYEGYRTTGEARFAVSSDQGKTWTIGNDIGSRMNGTSTMGRILELDDGTLVLPVFGFLTDQDMDGIFASAGVRCSSDNGASWKLGVIGRADLDERIIFTEPSVAMLQNGTLVALMRTEDRIIGGGRSGLYRAISKDGGKTWSSPVRTLSGTQGSVVQLPDGVLLCGYHAPPQLALSADNGVSWYAQMPWLTEQGQMPRGWYSSVEVVDQTTAVALIKEFPAPNIIRACLLHRQP